LNDAITTIYYLSDEFLKTIHHKDDPQVHLSTAEVMTVPLVAATFFGGNLDKSRLFLKEYGYMPDMISKSHLNRRLHAIASLGSGKGSFHYWPKLSRTGSMIPNIVRMWWTPCRLRCVTTSAFGAADFIL
jgi:hypothetical protein